MYKYSCQGLTIVLLMLVISCSSGSATSPSGQIFTGSLANGGTDAYSFTASRAGTLTASLTAQASSMQNPLLGIVVGVTITDPACQALPSVLAVCNELGQPFGGNVSGDAIALTTGQKVKIWVQNTANPISYTLTLQLQ